MSIRLESEIGAEDLAQHFGDHWEDFAEFLLEMRLHDGRATLRGQAEAVTESGGAAPRVSAYLRQLADAIDAAHRDITKES